MLKVPPALRDWKKPNTSTDNNVTTTNNTITVSPLQTSTRTSVVKINVISFEYRYNELSVMIEDGLTDLSMLEGVTKEGDMANEFALDGIGVNEGEQLSTPTNNITNGD